MATTTPRSSSRLIARVQALAEQVATGKVDAEQLRRLAKEIRKHNTLRRKPSLGTEPNIFYIGFTNTAAPWNDVNVREAVALGIDRQRIVDTGIDQDEFQP